MKTVKTVGILSMQRIANYGSFLQAYALRELLKRAGASSVNFIDIIPGPQLPEYDMSSTGYRVRRAGRILKYILTGRVKDIRRGQRFMNKLGEQFKKDIFPILELDNPNPVRFDTVVIGSDEVFNVCQTSTWGFSKQLYGDIKNTDKIISYAGSFGNTSYEELRRLGIADEISQCLSNLSEISVRDANSARIVKQLGLSEPHLHLDPVLIYDFSNEIAQAKVPKLSKYMIIYSYQHRINNKKEIAAIKSFAKKHDLTLVSIFADYQWADMTEMPTTPFDVLAYFKHAEYVVTDTFHGTIMSIITKSRFATLVRESNYNKMTSLLEYTHLSERASNYSNLESTLETPINYTLCEKVIADEQIETVNYLQNNI